MAARTAVVTERIVEKIIDRVVYVKQQQERDKLPDAPQGLHAEGQRRRP